VTEDFSKVYDQIANFENYSSYIPGCSKSELIEKNDQYEIGKLEFSYLLRDYEIRSKNILLENKIKIEQIDGPFISFEGEWKVLEKDKNITKILFTANFELPRILNSLLSDKNIDLFFKSSLEGFVDKISG
jgi:ribosome-associated toxin RatA of RatAB toxin-antitoxin module